MYKNLLTNGPDDARITFVFAHGAGASMDSPFMEDVATGLAKAGILVQRFEFPYMHARRLGKRRGPDRQEVLLDTWRGVIESLPETRRPPFIGGKSLGGRIASMVAQTTRVAGVLCFGYPFHPPGRPNQLRTSHLKSISVPVLIMQGERDPFGTPDEVAAYELSPTIEIEWIPDGDHSFKPRKRSGRDLSDNVGLAIRRSAEFLQKHTRN